MITLLLSGCSTIQPKEQENQLNDFFQNFDSTLSVIGEGVAPANSTSPVHAMVLAKRAAIADAYRQLGEKIYGIQLNANDTVKDAVLKNSTIKTKVEACIRNAIITENAYKDGLYRVGMLLRLDNKNWKGMCAF